MATKNLGEILLEQGVIDREALDRALQIQNRRLGDILIQERLADPVAIAQALKFQARAKAGRRSSRLSVETEALDRLLLRLEALEDLLEAQPAGAPVRAPLAASLASVRESVELMLLEPMLTLFDKARWICSQAAHEAGKDVELVTHGGGLVVARSLVDDLSDMVLHLIRNAIDHGLEPAHERVARGKPPRGRISLEVSTFGGRLILTLSDDGRGLDDERIYAKALERGLVKEPREGVSREELHRVLFTPGFSTSDKVTALSGRGVGLDVVEAGAIRLGGEVAVRSTPGQGALFRISVPLQAARLSVVPLRAGEQWLAVNAAEITSIERGSGAGLLSASSLFAAPARPQGGAPSAFKVECLTGSRWAFDEVGQAEDVFVREASAFAKGSHGVVGAARLRDGQSVLVVDLALLAGLASPRDA